MLSPKEIVHALCMLALACMVYVGFSLFVAMVV